MSIKDILILKNLNLKEYRWGFFIFIISFIITCLLFYVLCFIAVSFRLNLCSIVYKYSPISLAILKPLVLISVFIFLDKKIYQTIKGRRYYFTVDDWGKNWIFQGGIYVNAKNDSLVITDSNSGCLYNKRIWRNFRMTFKVELIGDNHGNNKRLGIIFRAKDLGSYYMFQIEENNNGVRVFPMVRMLGKFEKLGEKVILSKEPNNYYNVTLFVRGTSAELEIGGANCSWLLPTHFEQNIIQSQHGHNEENIGGDSIGGSDDSIPKIFFRDDYGKVGFRNHSIEKAEVSDLEIRSI